MQHLSGDQTILGNPTTFNSAAAMAIKLSLLDPIIFRRHDTTPPSPDQTRAFPNPSHRRTDPSIDADPLLYIVPAHVTPVAATQRVSILPRETPHPIGTTAKMADKPRSYPADLVDRLAALSPAELEADLQPAAPLFVEEVRKARETVAQMEALGGRPIQPGDDIEVITLGTGSSLPSKYRNGESYPTRSEGDGGAEQDLSSPIPSERDSSSRPWLRRDPARLR